MSHWKIKAWGLFVLGSVFFLMLLIVVLPDVDLPDATLHKPTFLSFVHSHARGTRTAIAAGPSLHFPDGLLKSRPIGEASTLFIAPHPNFRPILLRTLRC